MLASSVLSWWLTLPIQKWRRQMLGTCPRTNVWQFPTYSRRRIPAFLPFGIKASRVCIQERTRKPEVHCNLIFIRGNMTVIWNHDFMCMIHYWFIQSVIYSLVKVLVYQPRSAILFTYSYWYLVANSGIYRSAPGNLKYTVTWFSSEETLGIRMQIFYRNTTQSGSQRSIWAVDSVAELLWRSLVSLLVEVIMMA